MDELQELQAAVDASSEALDAAQQALAASETALQECRDELTLCENRLSDYQSDRNRLQQRFDQAAAETAVLREQVSACLADNQRLKSEVERLSSRGDASVFEVLIRKEGTTETRSIKGVFHSEFKTLVALAQARMNLFLYGPTGCGKTHVCMQLADVMGLQFGFVSCTAGMSESQLTGRLLPVGKAGAFAFVGTEFISCYEEGGLFLLDEIDAADSNVLLVVNSALSNGRLALPNRPGKPYAEKHEDFICAAGANTVGFGADRMYPGRNKLDGATLDRFQIGKVFMDYDLAVEEQLCPDEVLRTHFYRYRLAIRAHALERAVSTRFLRDCYKMCSGPAKWTVTQCETRLFSGWREDEVNKVKQYRS